jgi:hypothetical protein
MVLAIESDGAAYRDSRSVRDRDRLRQEHLERLGWRFHRLWSTNWFHDPQSEIAKLRVAYEAAIAADGPRRPGPDAEPAPDSRPGPRSEPHPDPRSAPHPDPRPAPHPDPQSDRRYAPRPEAPSGSRPEPGAASDAEPRPDTRERRRPPAAALADATAPAQPPDTRQLAPARRPIPLPPASSPGHDLEPHPSRGLARPD